MRESRNLVVEGGAGSFLARWRKQVAFGLDIGSMVVYSAESLGDRPVEGLQTLDLPT